MRKVIFAISMLLLWVACEHKNLCYECLQDKEVRMFFDWSNIRKENIPEVVEIVFRDRAGNSVAEFALPPEGGIVALPDGTYDLTVYNVGQYGNVIRELPGERVVMPPVSGKLGGRHYESPEFFCLENKTVVLTDSENSRVITMRPVRRTAGVMYEIRATKHLENVSAVYAVISGCAVTLSLYEGGCVERMVDGLRNSMVIEIDSRKLQGYFYMFGGGFTLENREKDEHVHMVSIYVVYKSGKYRKFNVDVTNQIPCHNPIGEPMEDFNLVIDLDMAQLEEGGDGSEDGEKMEEGFELGVEKWDDVEIDIPL